MSNPQVAIPQKQKPLSITVTVQTDSKFNCGCAFKSNDEEKAYEHCLISGHTVCIHGELRRIEVPKDGS